MLASALHPDTAQMQLNGPHYIACMSPVTQDRTYQSQGSLDDAKAIEAMGMGSWRLKGAMDPPFEGLTAQIEGLWRHMLEDLRLYPIDRVWLLYLICILHVQHWVSDCSTLPAIPGCV